MTKWTATITATTRSIATTSRLEHLALLLDPHGAAVAGGHADRLSRDLEVTLTVSGDDVVDAANCAIEILEPAAADAGLGTLKVRGIEIIDLEEHDRRLAEPAVPELAGIAEIAELLGVTRQRASTLQKTPGFPSPAAQLRSGPVWRRNDLDRFVATWARRPGRPPKDAREVYLVDPAVDRELADKKVDDEFELHDDLVRILEKRETTGADGRRLLAFHLETIG